MFEKLIEKIKKKDKLEKIVLGVALASIISTYTSAGIALYKNNITKPHKQEIIEQLLKEDPLRGREVYERAEKEIIEYEDKHVWPYANFAFFMSLPIYGVALVLNGKKKLEYMKSLTKTTEKPKP